MGLGRHTNCAASPWDGVGVARQACVVLCSEAQNDVFELALRGGEAACGHQFGEFAEIGGGCVCVWLLARQSACRGCEERESGDAREEGGAQHVDVSSRMARSWMGRMKSL